jgi:hypothetical protein
MKQLYVLLVVCSSLSLRGFAQDDYYWIGSPNDIWNDNSNWSHTSGGGPAIDFPSASTDNVIFDGDATVTLNTSVSINSLSVNGTTTYVKITATGGVDRTITVASSDAGNPGLKISAGCTLESTAVTNTVFWLAFAGDALGQVDGTWYFTGDINDNALASFDLGAAGFDTRLNVNNGGAITVASDGYLADNILVGDDYLVFNAGAALNVQGNSPYIPIANYNAASTINITGNIDASLTFDEQESIGNLTYNCPGQVNNFGVVSLSLNNILVKGDLNILSTNDNELVVINYFAVSGFPERSATIQGDLNIQGDSKVTVAHDGNDMPSYLYVEGNVIANGTSLDLQSSTNVTAQPTVLFVKGNIQHTAGTLSSSSTVVNETGDLFVIEMNGATAQTISSHNGTFDNAGNQVTLRINNAAGVSLSSSLAVGRLSFNTTNKGILSTGANAITINNTTPGSVSNIVLNSPSATGFVNGNIRRRSASTEPLLLATGAGTTYRSVTLIPADNTLTTFEANFVNSDHGGSFTTPVQGVANYYWNIARIGSGSDAAVQLEIPGAIPGALAGHTLTVARYNGTAWVSAQGATGLSVSPGTATSGTVSSEAQSSFGAFTIDFESAVPLPTLVVSFTAKNAGKNTAELNWEITENSTPLMFEVLRSSDGVNFNKIGEVRGVDMQFDYEFTDRAMVTGNNYYRLKMLDRDGSANYTSIVVVSNGGADGVVIGNLMPTVVTSSARLAVTSGKKATVQLLITDISGRIIQKQNVSVNVRSQDVMIDASRLSPGMYQITGYVAGEKSTTVRFIKQ